MNRARALLLAFALLPAAVQAAEITRIASSFEDDHPFGMILTAEFERTQQNSLIVRENKQIPPGGTLPETQDVKELRFSLIDTRLKLDAHIGLWKDFEFHYGIPVVFQQDRSWGYALGTDASNSTITNNCFNPDGSKITGCIPGAATPLFKVPATSSRVGLGNMTFGLAYAFFNQKKDDTKPMWIVGFDYTAPTADQLDPSVITTPDAKGNVGDKVHGYKIWTALSRRIGIAEPYFKLHYTFPYRGPGYYSNCDHPTKSLGAPQNCGTTDWSRTDTAIIPPHIGGIVFGSEFNAFEQIAKHQKVAIDIRGIATYVSEGRTYNEMSDLFGKMLYTQDYLQLGGSFALHAHAAEYVNLSLTATVLYNTEHTLTNEPIGKDLDGDGTVDLGGSRRELSPNFDFRTDLVSRRFRITETVIFVLNVSASFSF